MMDVDDILFVNALNFVESLGFHPCDDSFNADLFDEDSFRLYVLDCIGALVCFQKILKLRQKEKDDYAKRAKRRVFWQSLMQIASCAEKENWTNVALNTVLQTFPADKNKNSDGRSWLPLHFAVSLQLTDPSDISAIFSSNTQSIKACSDDRLINPCHLFAMTENPSIEVLQYLRVFNSRMGQSKTSEGDTPLHFAAQYCNSVEVIKELIQLHPPALRMFNKEGETPLALVFQNTNPMAPAILESFLQADPELIQIQPEEESQDLPIHICFRIRENLNSLKFLKILLQTNRVVMDTPTANGLLPAHIAASGSSVEVMKLLYEYSESSFTIILPDYGSVVHQAVIGHNLDVIKYIHGINPGLLLAVDNHRRTPLHHAVGLCTRHDFIEEVYALGPTAISKV